MKLPFNFYPKPERIITVPIEPHDRSILHLIIPVKTQDRGINIDSIIPTLYLGNILHIAFNVDYNSNSGLKYYKFIYLKISGLPNQTDLVQLKVNNQNTGSEPYPQLELENYVSLKKPIAHFKYIDNKKPMELVSSIRSFNNREEIQKHLEFAENHLQLEHSSNTELEFDSCTIPPGGGII
ncbi:hypothetical protein [Aquimarina sp. MMG016]|uniref:hypothetical protein n=1 Tax=Aquimarina sp. MMG016 TaxID=2822690 RepID=UPI001B3A78E4|nr:hypothetical protein [Aquimarina sp. MMG016]MBQ4820376.1 hypothetical protein [Aquimarina sp. MMG016]